MPEKLPLNVLLTKKCNARCRFCVEETNERTTDRLNWQEFALKINSMIGRKEVTDVLLLGGEPLYFPGIIDLVRALEVSPIITTNGHRLAHNPKFLHDFKILPLQALNISIEHYDPKKRDLLARTSLYENDEIVAAVKQLPFPVRINCLLLKGCIDSVGEISKMAEFAAATGAKELKIGEVTARNPQIHDFLNPEIIAFNHSHYVEIPDPVFRLKCHELGGTHFWKEIAGVKVYFNSPPDYAQAGGRDKNGRHYHRVLFNDGQIGFSWRRADGLTNSI